MNKNVKIIFGSGLGAGIGFVVGSIVADYIYPEYYTEEELEIYQARSVVYMNEHMDERMDDYDRTINVPAVEGSPKPAAPLVDGRHRTNPAKRDYTQYYRDVIKPETPEAAMALRRSEMEIESAEKQLSQPIDLGELDEEEFFQMRDETKPHVITEDEFMENSNSLRQAILKYYPEDDVLTDEADHPVLDTVKIVGEDALTNFGVFTWSNSDIIHVCNPTLGVNYKVVNMEGSYEEMVIGVPPDHANARKVHRNIFDDEED